MLPLRRLASVTLGKMLQSEPTRDTDVSANYLRAAHVQPNGRLISFEDDQTMWFPPQELRGLDLRVGDVVVVEGGAGFGRSATIRQDMRGWGFQNSIVRLRPLRGMAIGRFIDYALQSALVGGRIDVVCSTATIPHFTAEKVGGFPIPVQPVANQVAIANFLDRETAKIDALIDKQTSLVNGLRERWLRIIDQAIEQRNPIQVPLRREWMVVDCKHATPEFVDASTFPLAGIEEVQGRAVSLGSAQRTTELWFDDLRRDGRKPEKGDLVMTRNATVGACAVVTADTPPFALGQDVVLLKSRGQLPEFMWYVSRSMQFRTSLVLASIGSTFKRINVSQIKGLRIPTLPLADQHAVVIHLNDQTLRTENLIASAQRVVCLAQERRAALITAAVTGQLDIGGAA